MAQTRYKGALLAPWWRRVVAYLIDSSFLQSVSTLIVTVGLIPVFVLLGFFLGGVGGNEGLADFVQGGSILLVYLLVFVGYLAAASYYFFTYRGKTGRTLGSRAIYIRLVDDQTGLPLGGWRTFGRGCAHLLDLLPLGLGFLLPLVTAKKQTLADMIVRSVVVIDDRPVPPHITSWRRPKQPYNPQPQVFLPPRPVINS